MFKSLIKIALVAITVTGVASAALAEDKAESGQNAFTRAVQKSLSDVVTLVPNPRSTPCNGVVDCRKNGNDLSMVWQLNHTTDHSPKDYPQTCHVLGENGKYIFSHSAC